MTTALWTPSADIVEKSNMTAFIKAAQKRAKVRFENFQKFHQWSLEHPEDFWSLLSDESGVIYSQPATEILQNAERMIDAKWFVDSRLNFAENLLRKNDDTPAIVFVDEKNNRKEISYKALHEKVASLASFLKKSGIKTGDRVAALMPNVADTIIAMLATTSIGAIWSSCSPDFGAKGVLDRFGQIEPKILFASDKYFYNNKEINLISRIDEISKSISSLEKIVICPFEDNCENFDILNNALDINSIYNEANSEKLKFEQLPFDHPVYILYSSGTTGVPKCIVHGAGGTLLQHIKELKLHCDLKEGEKIFYFTTCGWMMWNWLVSSLQIGATIILYDGSAMLDDGKTLFNLIDKEKINVFGTSAKFISAIEKAGLKPRSTHKLSSLRAILSTGSPLLPENFEYVYRDIKSELQLSSISGGTDIVSCFLLGNPITPVYSGELQTPGLAMDVDIFDDNGNSLKDEKGELVCKSPFPSMPIYFWNDPDKKRYKSSYFEKFENIWCHGDWAKLTPHGGAVVYGRSDATLNPGGVRIGTAEIYRQVEALEEVLESLVVGQTWQDDVRIVLFVKLKENLQLSDELKSKIKKEIKANCSPRHVPAKIIQVPQIPRTISGKIVELAVKNIIEGKEVKNKDALANPEALKYFENLSELKT